jgi:hypothetical protein
VDFSVGDLRRMSWEKWEPSSDKDDRHGNLGRRNVALPRLLGWPIMLPKRMRAWRAPSSGEAGATANVAAHGAVVASPHAGTRITTRHVNPTPPAAFALNSAKTSTVLLCCCGARVCKACNREKAESRQIPHCICPSVEGFHPVGKPWPVSMSQVVPGRFDLAGSQSDWPPWRAYRQWATGANR